MKRRNEKIGERNANRTKNAIESVIMRCRTISTISKNLEDGELAGFGRG